MRRLTKEERKYLRQIASFYGCRVKFLSRRSDAYWLGNEIGIGTDATLSKLLSMFCHELGHFINWKLKRYPIYHNNYSDEWQMSHFKSFGQYVHYALRAEIYTENIGRELMCEWFPGYKFTAYYVNKRYCYEFLYGYYLGSL